MTAADRAFGWSEALGILVCTWAGWASFAAVGFAGIGDFIRWCWYLPLPYFLAWFAVILPSLPAAVGAILLPGVANAVLALIGFVLGAITWGVLALPMMVICAIILGALVGQVHVCCARSSMPGRGGGDGRISAAARSPMPRWPSGWLSESTTTSACRPGPSAPCFAARRP